MFKQLYIDYNEEENKLKIPQYRLKVIIKIIVIKKNVSIYYNFKTPVITPN